MQTPQETIDAVMSLIVEYRYETQPIETEREPTLSLAMTKQRELPPNCFLEGILVLEWRDHINTFLPPKQNIDKWIQQFIHMQWNILHLLWMNRCEVIHNKTVLNKVHNCSMMDNHINEILMDPPSYLKPHERVLFQTNPSILATHTHRYRRLWLQRVERIIENSRQISQASRYQRERRLMARWLQRQITGAVHEPQVINYIRTQSKYKQTVLDKWVLTTSHTNE